MRSRDPARESSWLPVLFAVAVALTPEFDLYGIPKLRLSDLLLLPLLLSCLEGRRNDPRFPFTGLMVVVMLWDFTTLLTCSPQLLPGAFYLGKRAAYFAICWAGYRIGLTRAAERTLWALLVGGAAFSLTVVLQLPYLGAGTQFRASGIIDGQESSTALFVVVILGLASGLWPSASTSSRRLAVLTALVAGVGALLATGTRGGLLCGLLLLTLHWWAGKRSTMLAWVALGAGLLFWGMTPPEIQSRFLALTPELTVAYEGGELDAGSSSVAARVLVAQTVWNEWIPESPMGTGTRSLGVIDNFYLTEWVYHGAVGLALFVLLLGSLLTATWRAAAQECSPTARSLHLAGWAALVALAAAGLSAESFYLIRPIEALMLLVGVVLGMERRPSP